MPALGHSYGTPTYKWAEDGRACTATVVCQRDANHIVTENATITSEESIAPTCEGMGTTTYTAKFTDSKFSTQTKAVVDIAALGHNYGEPTYEWAEDGSACTATTVCQRNENHIATEGATITDEETIAATCEEMGTTTYTATFGNELFATQTKDVVDIDALGHSYGEASYEWAEDGSTCTATAVCQRNENHIATEDATITDEETVAPTCEEMGTTTYTAKFENELFATQTKYVVDIDALGHSYGEASYEWAEDGSTCTATAVCQRNENHVANENATITNEVTIAATCEEMGTSTYTAKFTDSKFSTQTKNVVDIAALGHDYGTPTYEWADNGSTCKATTICQRNENHIATEDATITSEETIAPTCEEMGTTTYTAAFENELFATQTKDVVDAPANGHSYSTTNTTPTCTEVGYTTHTCSVCEYTYYSDTVAANGHTEVVDAAIAATCTTAGKTEGKHCSVCNEVLVAQEVVAALGHEFKTYAYNNDATTDADGTETAKCERGCGATDTKVAEGTKLPEPDKGTAVAESAASALNIYTHHNIIVVENATEGIRVYDAMGQLIERVDVVTMPTTITINIQGVYIVKTGNVTKRVMVF